METFLILEYKNLQKFFSFGKLIIKDSFYLILYMITGYSAGYFAGRISTRMTKYYIAGKILNKACAKVTKVAKHHKIDCRNPEVVTKNVFDCLEYTD